ncbi:MAG: hypothetical protein ACYCO9_01520 [Streptosporangiaceae bacterium]
MDDILSQAKGPGGSRFRRASGAGRGPWRRRLALAALVVAAAAIVVVRHLPGPAVPGRRGQPSASPAAGRGRVPPGAPEAVAAGLAGRAIGITGRMAPWPAALRLPMTGPRPAWFWPGTGRSERIGGLPADRLSYVFTRIGGGWAIQPDPIAPTGCGACAAPRVPVYFLASGSKFARRIGAASAVAPAAAAGALWLIGYPPEADLGATRGIARQVSDSGRPVGPPVRLPAGFALDRGTVRGLLLTPVVLPGGRPASELWNPVSGTVTRRFTGVIAATGHQIAWTGGCPARCRVSVLDLAGNRLTGLALVPGEAAVNGAFSPDGRYLAVQVSFASGGNGGGLAMQLLLADLASRPPGGARARLAIVPDTWVSSDALAGFGWPERSDRLVAELIFGSKVQVATWVPGARRPAVRQVRSAPLSRMLTIGG